MKLTIFNGLLAKGLFSLFWIFSNSFALKAQYQTLVADSFSSPAIHKDISLKLIWGRNQNPVSAFVKSSKSDKEGLSFSSIFLSDSALKYGSGFTDPRSLKTCTAIDYPLPPLTRNSDSIIVEFDAFWDTLVGIGEGGRIVLALLHQYPVGGPQFGQVDSVQLPAPFGRPAYNVRILNRRDPVGGITAPGYLFYGGGNHPQGEFEKTANWWLPGFIAQPGGTSPQTGPAYPLGGTTRIQRFMASSLAWQHFTFKVFPEWIEIWLRKSAFTDTANALISRIAIPKTQNGIPYATGFLNQFYGTNLSQLPLYYAWFPQIEAVRFYFRSVNQAYLANVKIKYSGLVNSIKENEPKESLLVYPNPSQDGIFWLKEKENPGFKVLDLFGKTVYESAVEASRIDLSHLPSGRYFLFFSSLKTDFQKPISIQILK